MSRLGLLSGTAALGLLFGAAAAQAADMPVYYEQPVAFGGWYLRGDIGMTNQQVKDIDTILYDDPDITSVTIHSKDFDPSFLIGLGVGYQFNEWFRADITGEYRAKSDFEGLDTVLSSDPDPTINFFETDKQEFTFLTNVYWDIGTWHRVTPFVGAGIGASYNKIGELTDTNLVDPVPGGNGFTDSSHGEWQFAWALHAGLAFAMTPNMTIELAYRFLHLGDAESANIQPAGGGPDPTPDSPLEFEDLYSHDIKLGLRYTFN